MKKIFLKSLFLTVILAGIFSFFGYVFAQPDVGLEYAAQTGLQGGDIRVTIANIIRVALGLLGIVAITIVLYGGFVWMTAGGDENKVATAKKILFNGVIGLIIILSAYAITSFVIRNLLQATGGTVYPEHCYNGVQDEDETGKDCGGTCATCGGGDGFNPYGESYLKIVNVPGGGQLCVRNFHPAIVFNLPVKLDNIGNHIKIRTDAGVEISGVWDYPIDPLVKDIQKNVAIFTPSGDCGDEGPDDCLQASTSYKIVFENANGNIESTDGKKLVCSASKGNCKAISFITGEGVDRIAPTIKINDLGVLEQGDTVPVTLTFEDDLGIQNVTLLVDGYFLDGADFTGCQKSGVITVNWPTAKLSGQTHTLNASVFDWSSAEGHDVKTVSLLPSHCFDGVLNEGETQAFPPDGPDCGGECLRCAGGDCQEDYQCTSGACVDGKCQNVMRIINFDPWKGAPGNYMTIFGAYFGNNVGEVYFGKTASANINDLTNEWSRAEMVNCGSGDNWTNSQIIVKVPEGINNRTSGSPILVKSSGNTRANTEIGDITDTRSIKKHFEYDSALASRPSLCAITPSTVSYGDKNVQYLGINFGNNKNVLQPKIILNPEEEKLLTVSNANDKQIFIYSIPKLLDGSYTTYVEKNGVKSNSLRVIVKDTYSANLPVISNITPLEGGQGEYITIVGKNFGNNGGVVYFYEGETVDKFLGSFSFPAECKATNYWTDKQIIVKFPKDSDLKINSKYRAQVIPSGKDGSLPSDDQFTLKNVTPAPGVCKIDPTEGPLPLPNNGTITAFGEYFGINANQTKVYFWQGPDGIASSTKSITDKKIESYTPNTGDSGPVRVKRETDDKFSNPINFTVSDCTANNNQCSSDDYQCCKFGAQKGVCISNSATCEGQTRATGYMWRFTTGEFPQVPHVVVGCNTPLPTPAPNVALPGDAENTCLTAQVTVKIDTPINEATIGGNHISVYKCLQDPKKTLNGFNNYCEQLGSVVSISSSTQESGGNFIWSANILENSERWEPNTWYQVSLTKDIKSEEGESLFADNPCPNINNSAYCFVFRTGAEQCVLQSVAVEPGNYLTKFLESPVKDRRNKNDFEEKAEPLYYSGFGLGDGCMAINTTGYDWSWSALAPTFVNIFDSGVLDETKVSALKNTVGEVDDNLVNDSARIQATANTGTVSASGIGALTVDLTTPEIIDFAPDCDSACLNAKVFARFNLSMSNNYDRSSTEGDYGVSLLRCIDGSDCRETTLISSSSDFTAQSNYRDLVLNLEQDLATNTYYKVKINTNTLFVAASSTNNGIRGKSFAKSFIWYFRTKDRACEVDRVEVLPPVFNAYFVGDKNLYRSEPYSKPDECSDVGQLLDPTGFDWKWNTQNPNIASTQTYKIKNIESATSSWTLATAVGADNLTSAVQNTKITGQILNTNKSGSADFNLMCGYASDDECPMGYGVAKNTCCYPRATTTDFYPRGGNICPNTEIKVSFDRAIDMNTLPGNLLIARGGLDSCDETTDVTDKIIAAEFNNLPWYKKVWSVAVNFVQKILGVQQATARWCTGEITAQPSLQYNWDDDSYDIKLALNKALKGGATTYKVLLGSGIKDSRGVSIGQSADGKPWQYSFTTWSNPELCKVESISVNPPQKMFNKANTSTVFVATVRAQKDQSISPVPEYDWDFVWTKDSSNAFRLDTGSKVETSNVTSNNQNGEGDVFVTVSTTKGDVVAPAKSRIMVFLCENPWPPFEVVRDGTTVNVWPFDDGKDNFDNFDFGYNPEITATGFNGMKNESVNDNYTNFSSFYCADAGSFGVKDDLPYMKPIVTTTQEAGVLKYYLLTNDKNSDAIGVKIFRNPDYLSLAKWMQEVKQIDTTQFNSLKVDGYEAMIDNRSDGSKNLYVNALNYDDFPGHTPYTIYSNIYLFSLSKYASGETAKVFEQMLNSLKFNVNLRSEDNIKACGTDYGDNEPVGFCNTDLDCLKYDPKFICLNQKEKMQRNYQRMKDGQTIKNALENYKLSHDGKYPSILDNTYLPGRAMSVWTGSWNELGSQDKLNMQLPVDPINKLAPAGTCLKNSNEDCIVDSDCTTTPTTGLSNYWEGEGNFIDSISGDNGIGQGVGFAGGVGHGQSFNFSSGNEKITIKHTEEFNSQQNNFGLSFWFKPTEQMPAVLFSKGGWSETVSNNTLGGFMVEYNKLSFAGSSPVAGNGTIRFAVFPSSSTQYAGDQYYAIDTQDPLTLNQWHHIVVRFYSQNGIGTMYMGVDNTVYKVVKTGTSTNRLSISSGSSPRITIGPNSEDLIIGSGLKGQIDEIKFYTTGAFPGTPESWVSRLYNGICQLHDTDTGWSAENLRLSFACASGSLAYGYFSSSTDVYSWRTTKEDENFIDSVWNSARLGLGLGNILCRYDGSGCSFVKDGKFIDENFCENPIISSNAGKCGNGIINSGEQCDPPKKIEYVGLNTCPTIGNPSATVVAKRECSNECQWKPNPPVLTCRQVVGGTCGDGIIQSLAGEVCDGGANCDNTTCQLKSVALCGNGEVDQGEFCDWNMCPPPADKRSVYYSSHNLEEFFDSSKCITNYTNKEQWSVKKDIELVFPGNPFDFEADFINGAFSCNSNCTGYGPYCGDGLKQTVYGEQCEGVGSVCTTTAGISGVCNDICKCVQKTTEQEETTPGKCGDGKIQAEEGEECDLGNDENGEPCIIPTGFSTCSWCTSDCKIRWNSCNLGFVADGQNNCPGIFWWPGMIWINPFQ